jgi:geranylgeranyl diphosphate/geranylgeranyl-bacteriochlorophyllide a reductase
MKTIAIVGGGPAGAVAAERLARALESGWRVVVFEERRGWEKPCGGGLPYKALRRYPFLLDACEPHTLVREVELVEPGGLAVRFDLRNPLAIYSRSVLNELLLRRAQQAGAEVLAEHVLGFQRAGSGWRIQTRHSEYSADYLVLAAGARSMLRRLLAPPFAQRDFMLTYGFYAPGADPVLRIRFFEDWEGYAWSFPRPDHLSLGICGKAGDHSMGGLQERLARFREGLGYDASGNGAPVFSHLLPALSVESWHNLRLAGPGWALAGDAAGLVDPVTGEGIYYAMLSGELLAEAILEAAPESYPERVWRHFGARLAKGSRFARLFYRADFLGRPATTRLVQLAARSAAFRSLLQDLIDGSQSYGGLAGRALCACGQSLGEMASQSLHSLSAGALGPAGQ